MIASPSLALALLMASAPPSLAALRWEKRVLLVSAAGEGDPLLREQRHIIRRWRAGADDRDLIVVEIIGDRVAGVTDTAASLRRLHRIPATGFAVALVGKDGGTKLRDRRAITAAVLEETIDAMPMRRAGER